MLVNCFLIDWKLSLITFVAIPITILPVVRIAKRLKKVTVQSQSTLGKISELVQETLSGIRVVQAYGMEPWESSRFREENERWLRYMRRSIPVRAFSSPLMEVMAAVGHRHRHLVGGRQASSRARSPAGKFFSFVTAVLLLYQPVKSAGEGRADGHGWAPRPGSGSSRSSTPGPTCPTTGKVALPPFREAIRYEDVDFSYGDRAGAARGLDLTVRKGEVVALVGSSGGGQDHASPTCCRASGTSRAGASPSTASTSARPRWPACAPRSRW